MLASLLASEQASAPFKGVCYYIITNNDLNQKRGADVVMGEQSIQNGGTQEAHLIISRRALSIF